jgi:hypothetical protein
MIFDGQFLCNLPQLVSLIACSFYVVVTQTTRKLVEKHRVKKIKKIYKEAFCGISRTTLFYDLYRGCGAEIVCQNKKKVNGVYLHHNRIFTFVCWSFPGILINFAFRRFIDIRRLTQKHVWQHTWLSICCEGVEMKVQQSACISAAITFVLHWCLISPTF